MSPTKFQFFEHSIHQASLHLTCNKLNLEGALLNLLQYHAWELHFKHPFITMFIFFMNPNLAHLCLEILHCNMKRILHKFLINLCWNTYAGASAISHKIRFHEPLLWQIWTLELIKRFDHVNLVVNNIIITLQLHPPVIQMSNLGMIYKQPWDTPNILQQYRVFVLCKMSIRLL